jgi:hypothetical protein
VPQNVHKVVTKHQAPIGPVAPSTKHQAPSTSTKHQAPKKNAKKPKPKRKRACVPGCCLLAVGCCRGGRLGAGGLRGQGQSQPPNPAALPLPCRQRAATAAAEPRTNKPQRTEAKLGSVDQVTPRHPPPAPPWTDGSQGGDAACTPLVVLLLIWRPQVCTSSQPFESYSYGCHLLSQMIPFGLWPPGQHLYPSTISHGQPPHRTPPPLPVPPPI